MSSEKENISEGDPKIANDADKVIFDLDWQDEMNVEFDPSPLGLGIHYK